VHSTTVKEAKASCLGSPSKPFTTGSARLVEVSRARWSLRQWGFSSPIIKRFHKIWLWTFQQRTVRRRGVRSEIIRDEITEVNDRAVSTAITKNNKRDVKQMWFYETAHDLWWFQVFNSMEEVRRHWAHHTPRKKKYTQALRYLIRCSSTTPTHPKMNTYKHPCMGGKTRQTYGQTLLRLHKHQRIKEVKSFQKLQRDDQLWTLPLLPDIADLACNQRKNNQGKIQFGATIDVTAAYNQCALTVSTAQRAATKIKVSNGLGGWITFIMKYLVGLFGCATAGNVYCVCAKTIHELHNAKKQRSLTYIDDGWLIDTADNFSGKRQWIHCPCWSPVRKGRRK